MSKEELIAFLKEELTLDIETESIYTGAMDGGELYEDQITIQLKLGDEVLSEVIL